MSRSTARRDDLFEQSYEELMNEHRSLEHRLDRLNRPRSMSPEEQAEMQRIKKRKLAIKDRLRTMEPH